MALQIESLNRLINSFSPNQLQDAAIHYLALRGYGAPELRDGWKDGGVDVRILHANGSPSKVIIQLSVERDWKAKLKQDAAKASSNYGAGRFILVSTRRIPELEFQRLRDEIASETGIQVDRVDSQSLASAFYESGETTLLLAIAGIEFEGQDSTEPKYSSFVNEAVFSFIFFSDAAKGFREGALECAIISFIISSESNGKRGSVAEASESFIAHLGLPAGQVDLVESAMDRMMQEERVQLIKGEISLAPDEKDRALSNRALNEASRVEFLGELRSLLEGRVDGDIEQATHEILPHLGALASQLGRMTAGAFGRGDSNHLRKIAASKLRDLEGCLHRLGVSKDEEFDWLVRKLAEVTADSAMGKTLMATELFSILTQLKPSALATAFGGTETKPVVVLDSNVAIPVLLNQFCGRVDSRFFTAAYSLSRQAGIHDLKLVIPRDYLEEAASHLISAARDYSHIVELDSDLAYSTNAFVSYYASASTSNRLKGRSFPSYLSSLGCTPLVAGREFREARNVLMKSLEHLFLRYGISVGFREHVDGRDRVPAEREISYALQKLGRPRPQILVRHDANIISQLEGPSSSGLDYHVIASWDSVMLEIAGENESAHWTALDPASLTDLLCITSSEAADAKMQAGVNLAMSLNEDDIQRGAEVLDWLTRHLKSSLSDSEQRDSALAFKRDYLQRSSNTRSSILELAWNQWKENH
ncbi:MULTISPECIES: hypothetical protein [unclassified Kitasatospora]|uniref:hypothetical protein n=1 Tax=unclassified Kitasatospora TaxID=2633591 RepID=UPI0012FA4EE3|nr:MULTISPECIES: hypothetical protein [unclassified Kitasatospora]